MADRYGRRTLVVVPTYDEAATVGEVITRLLALEEPPDVLVVDDGSPDGTGRIVETIASVDPRVRLIERPAKAGLASAYLDGFRWALARGYDLVVEMDADLSHVPEELPALLAMTPFADLVLGSRYVPGGSVTNWSRTRRAISRVGNRYAREMLKIPVADATSGFRVYRRALLARLVAGGLRSEGYAFQIDFVARTLYGGGIVREVPITFREREHGRSKISRRIMMEALFQVGGWGLQLRFDRERRLDALVGMATAGRPPGR
jgi:glycosyltransferase involved in cell wall biosynthesis